MEEHSAPEEMETALRELKSIRGVGDAIAKKMIEEGYSSLQALAVATTAELAQTLGISEAKARDIIQQAKRKVQIGIPRKASELLEERQRYMGKITTGSRMLDELLGGGVKTQEITEFVGEFGTGKSQIVHQLCVNVQLPVDRGGLEGRALFLDTEGTFTPERICDMASAAGLDVSRALDNVEVYKAFTVEEQMLAAERAWEEVDKKNIKLLVMDSLTALFRVEFAGRELLAPRAQKLGQLLNTLRRIANHKNVAVVFTNQVMAHPDVFWGDPTRPYGGHVVGHAATHRVFLRKSRHNTRIARIIDSPYLPEIERTFCIVREGIRDVPGT